MKVKIFSKKDPLGRRGQRQVDLENEINEWLAANPAIELNGVEQSPASWNYPHLFISVWYEEGAKIKGFTGEQAGDAS